MIEQSQAMPLLVAACPGFLRTWELHVAEHGNDLLYVAAGAFARHHLELLRSEDRTSLKAAGAAIETLHLEGSPWVQEFATIGILEGVQNVWANAGQDPDAFVPYLGNESRKWWQGLNEFWSGRAPVVRNPD